MLKLLCSFGLIGILASVGAAAHAQTFVWAKKMDGRGGDEAWGVARDASGNIYTTGFFSLTADFDPGPGTFRLTAAGGSGGLEDIFVSKLNSAGGLVWARRMGGRRADGGYGIAVDGNGNVYTAGYFHGTADFDPGPETFKLTATAGAIFVSKLDSSGNFVWARRMGGAGYDEAQSVAVDSEGNVYTTGYFENTADFDPGPGIFNLIASANVGSAFVSKLNSSGNFIWAKGLAGTGQSVGFGIALDGAGGVLVAGPFRNTIDFDPGPGAFDLTAVGSDDVFVLKLNSGGAFTWVKRIGGTDSDVARDIAADASGNAYTTGEFRASADFDPGPSNVSLISAGEGDVFFSKLDNLGNFVWARRLGGAEFDQALGVSAQSGSIYATGLFSGTIPFNPATGIPNLTSSGSWDIFVCKLNGAGAFEWAERMGGSLPDFGYDVVADGPGNVITSGTFFGTADFDPGPGRFSLAARGTAAFVSKLAPP